jgi:hypothetical protein
MFESVILSHPRTKNAVTLFVSDFVISKSYLTKSQNDKQCKQLRSVKTEMTSEVNWLPDFGEGFENFAVG